MLIKKKNIEFLEKDVADLLVKQAAVQIRVLCLVKGSVIEIKQFWKDSVDVKIADYLSVLALSCDDRLECLENCSVVPLLS